MVKTKRKTLIAFVITLFALTVFVGTFIRSVAYYPEAEIPLAEIEVPQPALGLASQVAVAEYPSRIAIPSLGIDAKVQHVGIAKSGNMAPPTNFTDVGWYKYGTVPGYRGSAVFAGHVDNALALAGVFKHLKNISVGEYIYVTNGQGQTVTFRVSNISTYDYKSVPTSYVFNQNDRARIRIITCDGAWNQSVKSYDKRLVVTADLVM
jgi:LPXTG-site transpeptidase (sortase) family protein